jgi:acetyl-CoA synthetase
VACSAGEPLNPEVIRWVREHLGCAVYDHYGQTEVGMVACVKADVLLTQIADGF